MSTVRKLEIDSERVDQQQIKRRHRHGRYSSTQKKYLWLAVWISWIITLTLTIYFNWIISVLSDENHKFKVELKQLQSDMNELQPQLDAAKRQMTILVEGKLPNISKLEYDKVITLDDGYLMNVVFTQLKKREDNIYEYKLVIQNNSLAPIRPLVDILLFDERGIQLGSASIGRDPSNGSAMEKTLDIGEKHSYSNTIELNRKGVPTYFMINRDYDPAR